MAVRRAQDEKEKREDFGPVCIALLHTNTHTSHTAHSQNVGLKQQAPVNTRAQGSTERIRSIRENTRLNASAQMAHTCSFSCRYCWKIWFPQLSIQWKMTSLYQGGFACFFFVCFFSQLSSFFSLHVKAFCREKNQEQFVKVSYFPSIGKFSSVVFFISS